MFFANRPLLPFSVWYEVPKCHEIDHDKYLYKYRWIDDSVGLLSGLIKSRPDLFPADALALAGEVLAFGSQKHPTEPWKTMTMADHVAAALRHYCEHASGRLYDVESGKKHLVHCLVRIAMAVAVDAAHEPGAKT